jgi:ketosteroid isomerase-like protein
MNRLLASTLLLSLGALALAQAPAKPEAAGAEKTDDPGRELTALEAELNDAIVRADMGFYGRVFAEDFTHTNHAGAFRTKAQWLANHDPGAKSPYDSFDTEDLSVRIYGETAVVTGRSTPQGKDSKGRAITGRFRFTRVWVRRDGRWQVVAFQGTRISSP